MPRTKKWLDVAIVVTYLVAASLSVLVLIGVLPEPVRASIVNIVDVFGMSGALSSKSDFPLVAQIYFPFCVWLYPVIFARVMLAFWAPTLPSYAKRVRGLARIQFFLGGLLLTGMGLLFPGTFHGQDARLLPIGSSTWGLIGFGWAPFAGGALLLALGLSGVFRSIRW
jgi:hypothetical protein